MNIPKKRFKKSDDWLLGYFKT